MIPESDREERTEEEPVDRDILASFDFDGLFFQAGAGWKIRKAALGVIGTRIPAEQAFAAFRAIIREDPNAEVGDYFSLDEYELSLGDPGSNATNQAPISRLLHYAHHHLFRRAELMVCVPRGFMGMIREMTDRAFGRLQTFRMFENPFQRAIRRHSLDNEKVVPQSPEEHQAVQVAFYAAQLRYLDMTSAGLGRLRDRFGVTGRGYEKIYVYHTQPELGDRLRSFLHENQAKLEGGRNAIVPMLIADVEAEIR